MWFLTEPPCPQKGYMVKVDSLGYSCSWVGCDSVGLVYPVGLPPPVVGSAGQAFGVYPNPAQNYLSINSLGTEQNTVLVLHDVLGRVVVQQPLGLGYTQLSIEPLPSGVYLYHIFNQQKRVLQQGKLSVVR